MTQRLLQDVDLVQLGLTVRAGSSETARFGANDQVRFEQLLRAAERALDGDRVRVVQTVTDHAAGPSPTVTVTLAVEHQSRQQYVPVRLELQRDGNRLLVTGVRIMAEVHLEERGSEVASLEDR